MKFVFRKLSLSRKLILGFMGAILMGTLLLMMPFSSSGEENLSFLTALFTITSAVCVTGLSVIDVGKELSTAGQIILLIFIQLGGLGIMTFSSFILLLVGKKITYEERELLKEERNLENNGGILWFLKDFFNGSYNRRNRSFILRLKICTGYACKKSCILWNISQYFSFL